MANTEFQFNPADLAGLKSAIKRNPERVKGEIRNFLVKGIAIYNRGIIRNPWMLGVSGGGAPVDTGYMRDTHRKEIGLIEAKIMPTVSYAPYVHQGTKRMKARPWLDYVKESKDREIREEEKILLENIVKDLAK